MPEEESVKETNSGVRKHGDMKEMAEFSEDVKHALEAAGIHKNSIEGFEDWRPKKEDSEKDIEEKTVEEASMSEKEVEKKSDGVKEDLSEAREATKEAGNKVKNGDNPGKEIKETSRRLLRPVLSESVKIARNMERKIYSNLMVKFNPYFFDSQDFSADIKSDKDGYTMEVNVPDEKYRKGLKSGLNRED